MSIVCGHCQKKLEFSGEPPSFCAYCGVPLHAAATVTYTPQPAAEPNAEAPTVGYDERTRTRAGPAEETVAEEAPERVGGYRLLHLLGTGGMGAVYEAEAEGTGHRVAVKLISSKFARDSSSLERFRQEGQLASQIVHPRCVFVLAADEENGRPYIVMELMPGTTLRDLVERRGPLPPQEAIAKILDVIDGLREAHRLGIVHRDVKPSNCFLLPDGRVKVGDFGLSKSLTRDANLTQTGAFLGTVLYAPPEQIKSLEVDFVSDVYAVCATLYFLLTGKAPFQHENPATVLAKVISEDARPPRELRPDIPRRLEQIVLRGLERPRERRWQSLDELHAALKALVPGAATRGALGLRFAAYLIDTVLLFSVNFVFWVAVRLIHGPVEDELFGDRSWVGDFVGVGAEFIYFVALEAWLGFSIGKYCLRLRVCPSDGAERPPFPNVLLRTAVFVALAHSYATIGHTLDLSAGPLLLTWGLAIALLVGGMRRRNGYRGLHEVISDTRVVQLPWVRRPRTLRPRHTTYGRRAVPAGQYAECYGPFEVRGVLHEGKSEAILLAEDPSLGAAVHVWVRPADAPELSPQRRSLIRATRARWLGGGVEGGRRWDAFFAPPGGPLADLVGPRAALTWVEARPVIEELTEELRAAGGDGTLPARLSLDQVWVQPDGRVHLLDFPLGRPAAEPDLAASLALVRQTAALALEGVAPPPSAPVAKVRAVVPRHAGELLERLAGSSAPFKTLDELHAALHETHDRPTEAARPLRAAHVGVQSMFLGLGVVWMFAFSGLFGLLELLFGYVHVREQEAVLVVARDPDAPAKFRSAYAALDADGTLDSRISKQVIADRTALARRKNQANLAERMLFHGIRQFNWPDEIDPDNVKAVADRVRDGTTRSMRQEFSGEVRENGWVVAAALAAFPLAWVVWAFITRGGLTLRLMGLALVRSDGRKAARWQCALRSFVVWAPVAALLYGCVQVKSFHPEFHLVHTGLWWAAFALVLACVVLAIRRPQQALHDGIAGTHVVPL